MSCVIARAQGGQETRLGTDNVYCYRYKGIYMARITGVKGCGIGGRMLQRGENVMIL